MSDQMRTIARDIRRALLVTAGFERHLAGGGRVHVLLSDQMRRIIGLVNELTFEAGEPGLWIRGRWRLARALAMDEGDASKAIAKLIEFEVLLVEGRGEGWLWIELRAARLAVAGRALEARAMIEEIERLRFQKTHQPDLPGCERSLSQARGFGLEAAISEVAREEDREAFAALPEVGGVPTRAAEDRQLGESQDELGRVPRRTWESPKTNLGESQDELGRVPTRAPSTRAGPLARADSLGSVQIGDSPESGAVAAREGSGKRFRDPERNWLLGELVALDTRRDLADETCRRTWLGRIRDCPQAVSEAIGEVKDEMRRGKSITSPLGRLFVKAQSLARAMGKKLPTLMGWL